MPVIEALLTGKTAVHSDAVRPFNNTQFAAFLVDELANRLSDVAEPRKDPPRAANTDRTDDRADATDYVATRSNHVETPNRHLHREDRHEEKTPRADISGVNLDTEDRSDPATPIARDPNNSKGSRGASEKVIQSDKEVVNQSEKEMGTVAHSEHETVTTSSREQSTPVEEKGANNPTGFKHASAAENTELLNDATETDEDATLVDASFKQSQTIQSTAVSTNATVASLSTQIPIDTSSGTPALETVQVAAAFGNNTNRTTSQPLHDGGISGPINVSGSAHHQGQVQQAANGGANIPFAAGSAPEIATDATPSSAKIKAPGIPSSNDTYTPKAGSETPQIVRDAQSIVSRPANATGKNLFHAHSQGEVQSGTAQASSGLSGTSQPNTHNVGQSSQLHVGNTPGGNSGHPGDQPTGQQSKGQTNNSNTSNPNTAVNQAGSNSPDPSQGAAQTQNNQAFQQALARGMGANAAKSTAVSATDATTSNRFEGPNTPLGSPQRLSSFSQTERAAPAAQHTRAMPSPAANQVSVRLSKAIASGESHMRIQLRPEELGRVEVKLDIANDGRAKALVMAERPETLELLQRDSRVLERALQDAGLKTDQNSLSFDLHGRGRQDLSQFAEQRAKSGTGSNHGPQEDDDPDEVPIPATAIGLAPDGSVNFLA